jgi:hypothetical protein
MGLDKIQNYAMRAAYRAGNLPALQEETRARRSGYSHDSHTSREKSRR